MVSERGLPFSENPVTELYGALCCLVFSLILSTQQLNFSPIDAGEFSLSQKDGHVPVS